MSGKKMLFPVLAMGFLILGACASVKNYGQTSVLEKSRLDRIVVGKSTMADVRRFLGRPMKTFNYPKGSPVKSLWMYDARRYHTTMGFATDAIERTMSITFTWKGVVKDIRKADTNPIMNDSNRQ